MADPIIKPTGPQTIAVQSPNSLAPSTNGDQPFGSHQMMETLNKAFEEARPNPFKPKPAEVQPETKPPVSETIPASEETEAPKGETKPATSETKVTPRAAQWKEVNEERDRLRKENETYKTQSEKYKTWESERGEYEKVKKHNDELLARVEAIALEKSPRFENYFKGKTETAISLAKTAVGEVHADRVSKLLQLPDSDFRTAQLDEVMSELTTTRQSRLGAAIVEMDRINLERSTALAKSKENWEATLAAERAEKQNHAQNIERTFQDQLGKWSDPSKGIPLFQKRDGDAAHNEEVEKRVENARKIINYNLNPEELSKAALWASSAPGLLKTLLDTSNELKAAREEIEALKAGGPDLKTGEDTAPVDDEKQYEGMSYGEIISKKIPAEAWRNR